MEDKIYDVEVKEYDLLVNAQEIDADLVNCFKVVTDYYISIGYNFKKILNEKMYIQLGYNSLFEYSKDRFNLSETTTKNFMYLFNKFGSLTTYGEAALADEYKDYSYSQLVELVSVPEEKINDYIPSLTVSEIRVVKKLDKFKNILVDELKKLYIELTNYISYFENIDITSKINFDKDFFLDDDSCELTIQCKYFLEKERSSTIVLKVFFDDGLRKQYYFDCRSYFCWSDVSYLDVVMLDLNYKSMKECIELSEKAIIDKRKEIESSEQRKKMEIQSKEKADELKALKSTYITSIDQIDSLLVKPRNFIISFFELLSKCNNGTVVSSNPFFKNVIASINQPKYYPILKFDKEFYITYGKLEIRFETYWVGITIYYGKEKKHFGVDALIDLLNQSNGCFYPIDLETVFMAEFINPMSDFENIEMEEIE